MTAMEWLLDSDPSIRWQVMRDLGDEPDEVVAAERARVATEGWGARLLDLQQPDGGWSDVAEPKRFIDLPDGSATYALVLLREMGLDPTSEQARRAVGLVRDNVRFYEGNQPFFTGEVEPCINGKVVVSGAYFGEDVSGVVDRLLGEQLADGGWNCEAERGSVRSSFHTTIEVLEGLLEHERAAGGSAEVAAARHTGEEYLLERRLLHRLSTGEVIEPDWMLFSYPTGWHYDVLRALDYLRRAGVSADDRMAEAIEIVEKHRGDDDRWPLQNPHDDVLPFAMEGEVAGQPSRWNTLRATRVLKWAGRGG
jgi:hypothetical protein